MLPTTVKRTLFFCVNCSTFIHILTILGLSRQIFAQVPTIKSHRNPSRRSCAVACRQTDRLCPFGCTYGNHLFRNNQWHDLENYRSNTWGVQVLRSPNFFLGEWKQVETWKLLGETWMFFRLGEAKWQHCITRWMLVARSSCSSVFDTEMATFTFEEQRVIIRFLHLRGTKPIEIHRQLSDGVMDVKNVRSWVWQFKEGRTLCDVGRSSSKVS